VAAVLFFHPSISRTHYAAIAPLLYQLDAMTSDPADINNLLETACYTGNQPLVAHLIGNGATNWHGGLIFAARGGHLDLVRDMIARGADAYDLALGNACQGGHTQVIDALIDEYGARDWNQALANACLGGQVNIALDFVRRGADDYDTAFFQACRGNHRNVLTFLIGLGVAECRCGRPAGVHVE
jgi:hypothetical protein